MFGTLPRVPAYKLNTHTYTGSFRDSSSVCTSPSCRPPFTFNQMPDTPQESFKKHREQCQTCTEQGREVSAWSIVNVTFSGVCLQSDAAAAKWQLRVGTERRRLLCKHILRWQELGAPSHMTPLSHARGKQHGAADGWWGVTPLSYTIE